MIKNPITARPNLFESPFLYEILNYLNASNDNYIHLKTVVVSTNLTSHEHDKNPYYEFNYRLESVHFSYIAQSNIKNDSTIHSQIVQKIKNKKECTQFINEINWFIDKEHTGYFRKNVITKEQAEPVWYQSYNFGTFRRLLGAFMKMSEEEVRSAIVAGIEKDRLNKGVKKTNASLDKPKQQKV